MLTVTIEGPPCSGKTVLAHRIAQLLTTEGHAALVVDTPTETLQEARAMTARMAPVQVEIATRRIDGPAGTAPRA